MRSHRALRTRSAPVLVLAALLWPGRPAAAEPWMWAGHGSEIELRAFYKMLATGLRMQRGLVDVTDGLADVSPAVPAVPLHGGLWAHTARLWGRLVYRERLELQAGWQVAALFTSDPAFAGGAAVGSSVPLEAVPRARRRLVDFAPVLADGDHYSVQHDLDLLAAVLRTSVADVTVGRQVLSWGSGRLWNPTDLLSPFAPTDVDREVRRGVDAVRVSIPLVATAQLDLLWLPQDDVRDQGGVARAQFNAGGFDIAGVGAKIVRDGVLGLDVTGDVGEVGVHTEAAWTSALDRNEDGERDRFVRAVAGADVRPTDELVLTGEYYFNGWGARHASGYLDVLRSDRVRRGEVFGAGRHYLGLIATWRESELLTVQGTVITNLADPSAIAVPSLEYWAAQHVLVRVGGYLPLGRQPDASAARRLTQDDAAQMTDAWRDVTGTLGLRSEYGASPFGLFAQLAVYPL